MKKPRKGRHGEPDKSGRYVKLHHWMMKSPAWQSLDGNYRSIYIEWAALYRGPRPNNGYIFELAVKAEMQRPLQQIYSPKGGIDYVKRWKESLPKQRRLAPTRRR